MPLAELPDEARFDVRDDVRVLLENRADVRDVIQLTRFGGILVYVAAVDEADDELQPVPRIAARFFFIWLMKLAGKWSMLT